MSSLIEYLELEVGDSGSLSYVNKNCIDALRNVDTIIFDCDGVLIDVRESYDWVILRSIGMLLKALTGLKIDQFSLNEDALFELRKTGGFNNDIDLTYALIVYLLSGIPEQQKKLLKEIYLESLSLYKPYDRFQYIASRTSLKSFDIDIMDISSFAKNLDETGLVSLERYLNRIDSQDFYWVVKRVLGYPGNVKNSMLTAIFEEFFCGSELYMEIFSVEPAFVIRKKGLIERERLIINSETLTNLVDQLGKGRFGIASGSFSIQAEYVLGDLLKFFNPSAVVWMDDVNTAINKTGEKNLHKPNPYSLIRASEALEPKKNILYIGDTQADLVMVKKTNATEFLFAGVYDYTSRQDKVRDNFLSQGACVVAPSVNDLPIIFDKLKE